MMTLTPSKRARLLELLVEKQRRTFPTLDRYAYFNYGAQGLLSQTTLEATQGFFRELQETAPFTTDFNMNQHRVLQGARAGLAQQLATEPRNISLVENTSFGANIVLWGLEWRAGDHLLVSDREYPGLLAAIGQLADRFELEIGVFRTAGDDQEILDELAAALRPETRLVVVSHITWDNGRILPLTEMVRMIHAGNDRSRVLVDGAQSIGVLPKPVAETGADYVAFTGHKWLCGPCGTGGFYASEAAAAELRPSFIGPRGLNPNQPLGALALWDDGRRFEISTQSAALYAGLQAALKQHRGAGSLKERFDRLKRTAQNLYEGLQNLRERGRLTWLQETPPQAGLVFFSVSNNRRLVLSLEADGCLIRQIPTNDRLRVSIHYLTLGREVERLLAAIERAT